MENKKQGFIVEKPQRYDAFYRKVGEMAKIVTTFIGVKSCFFVGDWVKKQINQILQLEKVGRSGELPIPNLQASPYKGVPSSAVYVLDAFAALGGNLVGTSDMLPIGV